MATRLEEIGVTVAEPIRQDGPSGTRIPKERYTSPDWLALEYERLWPRVWQMACRIEEVPQAGDFMEYRIGDQSVLIVRDGSDSIRAYHNACLHRGTRLCIDRGNAGDALLCRFHGWSWNLDGSIAEVPDAPDFPPENIGRRELQLPEVHVDTWGGFVFVNMAEEPGPLLDFLAPIPERLAPFEVDKMRLLRHRTTIMDCNWKVGLDAFNEAYHVEATHVWDLSGMAGGARSISRAAYGVGDESGQRINVRNAAGATPGSYAFTYEAFETHNMMRNAPRTESSVRLGDLDGDPRTFVLQVLEEQRQISLAHQDEIDFVRSLESIPLGMTAKELQLWVRREVGIAGGIDYSHINDDDLMSAIDYCLYPNMVGPISAGNWILFRFRPNGDDPDTCIFDVFFLHRYPEGEEPSGVDHEWYADWREHDDWGSTLLQDLANMGLVQQGLHQRSFRATRLNRQEAGIRNHHEFLDRYMGV